MPTKQPRAIITANDELMNAINHYQNTNHIGSQSKAIIDLISRGIEQARAEEELHPLLSYDELVLVNNFRNASPEDCARVRIILTQSAQTYKKPDLKDLQKSGHDHILLLQMFDACPAATQQTVLAILRNAFAQQMEEGGDA